jgi:hypothetical protein
MIVQDELSNGHILSHVHTAVKLCEATGQSDGSAVQFVYKSKPIIHVYTEKPGFPKH